MAFDCPLHDKHMPDQIARGRTLFLSDLHLGALSSNAAEVLQFLHDNPAQTYVLVGDILDLWQPLLPYWSAQDQAVIDHLQARAAKGARLIYVRGNHDPDPALIPDHAKLNATHVHFFIHHAANGKRYLVLHGDEADGRLIRLHAMTRLGSRIDHALRRIDRFLCMLWRRQPHARGSVDWLIKKTNSLSYRGRRHEEHMVRLAHQSALDGVICGHFHIAGLHDHFGLIYANCGDWIDSMTAIEDPGCGTLRLIDARACPRALPHSDTPLPTKALSK